MAYVALYRQWRPQDFDALVGQKAVKTTLKNALASGKIAHAYLFSGPRGTGKTSMARILAKALNCEQGPTAEPCGQCGNCQRIVQGTSLDVIEIDAASNTSVDNIRDLREQVAFTPAESRYKVYIIDEVHMLSTGAFNALLKTLEEPPAHAVFILATTDPQKVPATIQSRCQRFEFRRVTVDEIAEHLAMVAAGSGIEADADALRLIAIQAEGGMRDALSLLDQCGVMAKRVTVATVREVLGIVGREALHELTGAIGRRQLPQALATLNLLLEQGKDVKQVLTELIEYLRALVLYLAVPDYEEIYLTDTKEALAELAPLFGRDRLLAAEERLHGAIQELRGSMRPRITAEMCLLDLCRVEGSTLAALSARIEQLERQLAGGVMPVYQQAPPAPVAVEPAAQPIAQEDFAAAAQQQIAQQTPAADQMQAVKPAPAKKPAIKAQPQPAADTLAAAVNAVPKPKSAKVQQTEEYAGDFAAGEDFWKQALEIMKAEKKNSMVSCAKNGRVFSFANNILQVAFKAPFLADRMNKDDYRKAFEEVLLRLARREIRLEAVIEGKAKLPQPPVKQQEVQQSPESEAQNLQAAQLPENLRRAFNALGGSVTDISDQ
ncbi:DNA polymerase III subunit gamma/tau [Phascolarctobacterium sp. Marseille-Q4147]|uniref:DNA polymerase III subunit gamma/tau n=1 Tax=Phascolarctobacterium sp. Marseille-Q4147 TaxID=2823317 RepID=UPI001B325CF6|nr:DNA polymerase III subunit gamma/tau [Phascolarctobacterium sp. Marseille-Q4147]QTV78447.1 DNA polymerase III subunit gamma/tau [Phascolarctobacterium sp. Marseille-Q4147]